MKKILISSALAASLFGVAQAQTSGLFVGVKQECLLRHLHIAVLQG